MVRPAVQGVMVRAAARLSAALRGAAIAVLRRGTIGQLGQMDDRMLRDIGLSRHDLWGAAAEPLFRDPTVGLARRAGDNRAAARASARERNARAMLARLWTEESRAA